MHLNRQYKYQTIYFPDFLGEVEEDFLGDDAVFLGEATGEVVLDFLDAFEGAGDVGAESWIDESFRLGEVGAESVLSEEYRLRQ